MEDLIRRSDAINVIEKNSYYIGGRGAKLKIAIAEIKALPSADRPQGEWIDAEIPLESGGSMPIQVCNLCKTFYPLAYTGGGHRFCPNCGSKMRGEHDD